MSECAKPGKRRSRFENVLFGCDACFEFRASDFGFVVSLVVLTVLTVSAERNLIADEPPSEWIERNTGHRVIRLSPTPGTSSFYFHQNGFTVAGDKLVVGSGEGLVTIDLRTR